MKKEHAFQTFPITTWEISSVEEQSNIAIKFGYSTSPYCTSATHFDSQFFSLSPEMARNIIHELTQHISRCEGGTLAN
jgi:biofilm regulator BssS